MSNGLPGLEGTFSTLLVDPPWRFQNRTGKMAPEHKRLRRYRTMTAGNLHRPNDLVDGRVRLKMQGNEWTQIEVCW